jgi:hypothetical protein
MKKQSNMTSLKASNSTIVNANDSEEDEIPDSEFKRIITEIIHEIKRTQINFKMNLKRNS